MKIKPKMLNAPVHTLISIIFKILRRLFFIYKLKNLLKMSIILCTACEGNNSPLSSLSNDLSEIKEKSLKETNFA